MFGQFPFYQFGNGVNGGQKSNDKKVRRGEGETTRRFCIVNENQIEADAPI